MKRFLLFSLLVLCGICTATAEGGKHFLMGRPKHFLLGDEVVTTTPQKVYKSTWTVCVYSMTPCGPCVDAKNKIKSDPAFTMVEFPNLSTHPSWVREHGYPCVAWRNIRNEVVYLSGGFPGVGSLKLALQGKLPEGTTVLPASQESANYQYPPQIKLAAPRPVAESVESAPTPMEEVVRVLDLLPEPNVGYVDFGCGDGRWLIAAAQKWPAANITGVEIDPIRAAATRERIANEGLSHRINVITGDATTTPVSADIATVYLYPDTLAAMKPQLAKMRAVASYMHSPAGLPVTKNGDSFFYFQSSMPTVASQMEYVQQKQAVWGGQMYSGPVCNNPHCQMCNSIRNQLAY